MERLKGFAITASILAVAGLFVLAPLLGGMAVIFGFYSLKTARGKPFAITGIILGALDVVTVLVYNLIRNP
ncbi:MAG: hypothetical protein DRJ35_07360 [Thermoprotei archaeon]|nr:MAG: hypothetical protein DRJ35_07360 [Thermoprotei archaeon]